MISMLYLSARDEIASISERRNRGACVIQRGVAAGVIEMEMSIDNDSDFFRPYSGLHKQSFAKRSFTLDPVHRCVLCRPLNPNTGFNQNLFCASIDEHAIHVHANTILLVGGTLLRPQGARNYPKHRPSIEPKLGIRNNFDEIIAYLHLLSDRH